MATPGPRPRASAGCEPRFRRRQRQPSRGLLIAIGAGLGALALGAALWLASRPGSEAPTAPPAPGQTPAAPVSRDVIVVALPASYADPSVGRLAAQLRSPDLRARIQAAHGLAGLGPRAVEAIPALLNAMSRRNSEIEFTQAVSKALKAIGRAAVPQLVAVVRSGVPQARFHAVAALARLGPEAADAVGALTEALDGDADMSVRSNAAVALGAIGPAAASALPALRRAVGNPNERLTGNAARAELRVRAQMAIDQIKGK